MEPAVSSESIHNEPKSIHVLEVVKDEFDLLNRIASEELSKSVPGTNLWKRRVSRSKHRKSASGTPSTPVSNPISSFDELVEVKLKSHNVRVMVPKFLSITVNYVRRHLDEKGLFRIDGSAKRVNALISSFGQGDAGKVIEDEAVSVFDVCTVMKKLIRKMEEPLIPMNLQTTFARCVEVEASRESKYDYLLLAICLMSKTQIHTLLYLIEFLHEVTGHSEMNKMDAKNLAIVLTPSIMWKRDEFDSGLQGSAVKFSRDIGTKAKAKKELNDKQVEIIKMLIEVGNRAGIASENLAHRLVFEIHRNATSEDELENDGDGRKRKRRSASLNRKVFEFIRKKKLARNPETPATSEHVTLIQSNFTPGVNTPVIGSHSRKWSNAVVTPMSTNRKNRILSAIQRKGLLGRGNLLPSTPNAGVLYQSPTVSLNPRAEIKEDVSSAIQASKTGISRTSRTMHRSNGSKSLPERNIIRDEGKSTVPIVALANSPRKSLPRCTTPPSIVSDYDEVDSAFARHEEPSQSQETDVEVIQFTPVVRGINELMLAALEDTPVNVQKEAVGKSVGINIDITAESESAKENNSQRTEEISNRRMTRSQFNAETRRCQSFNEAFQARSRGRRSVHLNRTRSDGSALKANHKMLSPSFSPILTRAARKNALSLSVLNRSPTRCTLRRGRPNTMRTGLPRPSPTGHKSGSDSKPQVDVTPISNITMDRKGRVSRKIHNRPALIFPNPKVDSSTGIIVEERKEQKIVKPPRKCNGSKLQSPKKVARKSSIESKIQPQQSPQSFKASKLKRDADQTAKTQPTNAIPVTPTTPFSTSKGRSYSMRSDMIRPSPRKINTFTLARGSRAGTTEAENAGNKTGLNSVKSLVRAGSVQELVKKFDATTGSNRNQYNTLMMRRGKIATTRLSTGNKPAGAGTSTTTTNTVPPPKPPRTSFVENRSTTGTKFSTTTSKKQVASFNALTKTGSTLNVQRASKQVLKTMNIT